MWQWKPPFLHKCKVYFYPTVVFVTYSIRWGLKPPAEKRSCHWAGWCAPETPAAHACFYARCLFLLCEVRCQNCAVLGSQHSRFYSKGRTKCHISKMEVPVCRKDQHTNIGRLLQVKAQRLNINVSLCLLYIQSITNYQQSVHCTIVSIICHSWWHQSWTLITL